MMEQPPVGDGRGAIPTLSPSASAMTVAWSESIRASRTSTLSGSSSREVAAAQVGPMERRLVEQGGGQVDVADRGLVETGAGKVGLAHTAPR